MKNTELEQMLLGKFLGEGIHRKVYIYKVDPDFVIKVAHDTGHGKAMNILEFEIWNRIEYTKVAQWFAEVTILSQSGKYLIQRKAKQIEKSEYPDKIPHFFTDLQYRNFGMIGKNFVCVDYGAVMLNASLGLDTKRVLKKAKWYDAGTFDMSS